MKKKDVELLGACGHKATNDVLYNGSPVSNYRVLVCDSCLKKKPFFENILEIKKIGNSNV